VGRRYQELGCDNHRVERGKLIGRLGGSIMPSAANLSIDSRINPDEGIKPIAAYLIALLIGTIIVAAVPWISIGFL